MPDQLLTADDLADRWKVRKQYIWQLTRDGHLVAVELGRYRRYRLADVVAFEERGGTAARLAA